MEPLCVLVGPTASGKTGVSLLVARDLGAEIVSLDSMLLYRGMDIGTDKAIDTHGVPHHLIDCLDPSERFDLQRYVELADEAIEDISSRGRRVLVVGGTGLYLMALLKGIFADVPRSDELRARYADEDLASLHARLREADPATAAKVHANDRRRITRALEVYETTGRPLSELQTQFSGPDRYPVRIAGIEVERPVLKERIEARVHGMFLAGLVDEVASLELGPTAGQAVGYKEVRAHLDGEYDLEEAKVRIVRHTLRLARRQRTWFKRFDIAWMDGLAPDLAAQLTHFFGTTTE